MAKIDADKLKKQTLEIAQAIKSLALVLFDHLKSGINFLITKIDTKNSLTAAKKTTLVTVISYLIVVFAGYKILFENSGPSLPSLGFKNSLEDAIDPVSGSFEKFKKWKAESGSFSLYGVHIHYINVEKDNATGKIIDAAMDTVADSKLSSIQNASAKLCHTSAGKYENTENDTVYFGSVDSEINGYVYHCSYMTRHSDGVGSISMTRQ